MTGWINHSFSVGPFLAMCYCFLIFQEGELYLLLEATLFSSLAKGCFINSQLTSVSCHFLLSFHLKEDSGHVIIMFCSNCHKDAEWFLIRSGSIHGKTSAMLSEDVSFLHISVIELYSSGWCNPSSPHSSWSTPEGWKQGYLKRKKKKLQNVLPWLLLMGCKAVDHCTVDEMLIWRNLYTVQKHWIYSVCYFLLLVKMTNKVVIVWGTNSRDILFTFNARRRESNGKMPFIQHSSGWPHCLCPPICVEAFLRNAVEQGQILIQRWKQDIYTEINPQRVGSLEFGLPLITATWEGIFYEGV